MNKWLSSYFLRNITDWISTGTASAGAVTVTWSICSVTTESLSTAAAGEYTLTVTDTDIWTDSIVFATVWLGTSTTGTPWIWWCTVTDNTVVITVTNLNASAAFNGTLLISFLVINPKG